MSQEFTKIADEVTPLKDNGSKLDLALFKSVDFKCMSHKPPTVPEGVLPNVEIEDGKPGKQDSISKGDKEAANGIKEGLGLNNALGSGDITQNRSVSEDAASVKNGMLRKNDTDVPNKVVDDQSRRYSAAEKCGNALLNCDMPDLPLKNGKIPPQNEKKRAENRALSDQVSKHKFDQSTIMLTPPEQEHQTKKVQGDVTRTFEKEKMPKPQ